MGIEHVVLAGLSNAYSGYVATREEYSAQNYEGGSTHFGPWATNALQQEFHRLAGDLKSGRPSQAGPQPRVLSKTNLAKVPGADKTLPGFSFGDVLYNAQASYKHGQRVMVMFQSGHPRNHLKTMESYLEIQRQAGTSWTTIATENDPETLYRWNPSAPGLSIVTAEWTIPVSTQPGVYRVVHHGHSKSASGAILPYRGQSRRFAVTP
jgi:neutral ceramidase